jgi:beta-galactosidase
MDLMRNWRDQVVAQVKGERNHPSIMIWSIENEWLYINCINLYGSLMDLFEAEVVKTSDAVRAVDPTRPTMTDGGGATKANAMPVQGDHYTTGDFTRYPELAYDPNPTGGGRGRWVWDQKRPRFIGEELFAQGHNPDFAYFGGEEVFVGQVRARPAVGLFVRMLTEGYRWSGNGAVHFWQMQDAAVGQYAANAPRAVFCRQWDWTFASGQKVERTFGIFNDTHSDEPITFRYTLEFADWKLPPVSREYTIAPGSAEKFDVTLALPHVNGRHKGQLTLTLFVKGEQVFQDVKPISILAPSAVEKGGLSKASEKQLLVFDPHGSATAFLTARKVPFTALKSLENLPATGKVLLIGKDALDAAQSTSSALAAHASAGRTVIVLEQKNPLKFQAIPADMDAAVNEGRTAFGEDLKHPALARLEQEDFFTWGPNEVVYRNAYVKPTRGARSLVQCDRRLQNSALVEVPAGNGLLLLCQLVVGEKLASNVVAQQLLINLLDHGADYTLEYRPVVAAIDGDPQLPKVLAAIGLKHARLASPLEALATGSAKIVVVAATPENLKLLAENIAKVRVFTLKGGYLVLHGLTPEGLSDYNKLVGFDHMIRPFGRERVTLPPRRHPLTAGLAAGDVALYSSKQIFNWQPGNYVASDVFSYVVDFEDVAPFAKFPNDFLRNMVGGFTSADGWPLIVNLDAPTEPPLDWLLKLPKEQELVEMEWTGNTFYYPVTRVELISDGKTRSFAVKPNNEPQTFAIEKGLRATDLTLRLADWEKVPGKARVTGLDHIVLKARRPAEFYQNVRPMLNIGAMMEYPRGKGGIVLCNLLFKDVEEVPANVQKKRVIFATILRNLKAEFSGGKSVIAGANLNYQPLDLSKQANQYRDDKGWFGDKKFTFKDLPTGRNTFAGVPYNVYDFATSPTVVMLGGPGVPNKLPDAVKGIPVNRKADALFFLHVARLDTRRNEMEVKEKKQYELCRYVVNYEDGKTVDVPVYAEIDVEDFRQKMPAAIPGAQIGWTRPYEGTGFVAVAYSKQWDNPRPDAAIKSIDLVYGPQRRGVPVLLAVTAASMEK